jgi:hypothetical protein
MAPNTPEVDEMELLTPKQIRPSISEQGKQSSWYTPRGWLWEISAMVASLCCTTALVILLLEVQDAPYEDWRFSVGLNPTISTLTTIARGTLLLSVSACLSQGKWLHFVKRSQLHAIDVFDQASRGPLGALTIVLKSKTYLGLPTLAAAITIFALAIGPFTQQVVTYDQGSSDVKSQSASFDYAHTYSSGAIEFGSEGGAPGLYGPTDENVDADMQGAIYRGLYQNQSQWTPSFNCPSDCKWPDTYTILGFAGICENVTVATLATKHCVIPDPDRSLQNCKMETPRGVNIDTVYIPTVYETVSALNATIFAGPPQTQRMDMIVEPEIATYAFYKNRVDGMMSTPEQESVWECSLNLTAYKYSNVASTSNAFEIGHAERIPLEPGFGDNISGLLTFNQSGIPELSVIARDLGALKGFFQSTLFTGRSIQGESRPAPQLGCNPAFMANNASDVTAKLAKSMTDALQRSRGSQEFAGSYKQAVTYVRVRWVWLILLGVLEAAGTVLLICTIVRAGLKKNVLLWKSSQSALLFSHVDSDGLIVTPEQGVKALEERVKTTTSQLLRN